MRELEAQVASLSIELGKAKSEIDRLRTSNMNVHVVALEKKTTELYYHNETLKAACANLETLWQSEHTERIRLEEQLKHAQDELKSYIDAYTLDV